MNNQCKETFLNDIVRIQLFRYGAPNFPVPPTIPRLTEFSGITCPTPVLDIAYSDAEVMAQEETITLKQSSKQQGSYLVYIYNVECTVEVGNEKVTEVAPVLNTNDLNVLVTRADGSRCLLYTLPGSFDFSTTDDMSEMQLKLALTSLSSYIEITE